MFSTRLIAQFTRFTANFWEFNSGWLANNVWHIKNIFRLSWTRMWTGFLKKKNGVLSIIYFGNKGNNAIMIWELSRSFKFQVSLKNSNYLKLGPGDCEKFRLVRLLPRLSLNMDALAPYQEDRGVWNHFFLFLLSPRQVLLNSIK
jgi:hypothetical protein